LWKDQLHLITGFDDCPKGDKAADQTAADIGLRE